MDVLLIYRLYTRLVSAGAPRVKLTIDYNPTTSEVSTYLSYLALA